MNPSRALGTLQSSYSLLMQRGRTITIVLVGSSDKVQYRNCREPTKIIPLGS